MNYITGRKRHVRVDQDLYLMYIQDCGPQSIGDLSEAFNVHVSTARRKLDGLMWQDKLFRLWKSPWTDTIYWIPGHSPEPFEELDKQLRMEAKRRRYG